LSWFVVSIIFRVISGSSANVDGWWGTTWW
jgi:hypothetical protein